MRWKLKVRKGNLGVLIVRVITTKQILEVGVCNAAGELFMMQWKEKAGSNSDSGECTLLSPTVLT